MPNVRSLMVLPADPSMAVGANLQFSAVASYNDGSSQDVTASAAWQSSNPAVAAVDAAGLVTAEGDGSALISASFSGYSDSSALVVNVTLLSLDVAPASANLSKGQTLQFTATGTYSDSTSQDVTNAVTWLTSDSSVLAISEAGLATGIAGGYATIAARTATVAKIATVTVTAPLGLSPCEQLVQLQQQMALLLSGRATVAVETPQLGRVEFSQAKIGDLQILIDRLAAQCAESQGLPRARRRPFSMEVWP